ncbi:hypothetical protein [Paraburkholderia kururiensis]|uniref:DUF1579 domain-containing protein n=1 Tax=Paraburkholderia kururiensis TaxID=984307 RepID=A0ABZ0WT01_9BURK|nr:hypothetical protein [Paraburkholderia kururiensis]WQD80456.1 hypothetical protein U0042_12660 [Paraburkholderia kururiensis]
MNPQMAGATRLDSASQAPDPLHADTAQGALWSALGASGRAADIAASDDLYGWLAGSWTLEVLHYRTDMRAAPMKAEAHFAWVLDGRAMQDVWIFPARSEWQGRTRGAQAEGPLGYGTTLRVWDPALRAWRVTWIDPVSGQRSELIGRRVGDDIVQIGTRADGTPIRWNFTHITANTFRWTGTSLEADGVTWKVGGDFIATRVPA